MNRSPYPEEPNKGVTAVLIPDPDWTTSREPVFELDWTSTDSFAPRIRGIDGAAPLNLDM